MMGAPGSNAPIRAAQYLRMSSENQRYSTENQHNAITEYAGRHGYVVVASYVDAGRSGLSLKGRDALKQLLSDALARPRAFDAVLVLDVSRWGRFQNPDQAAHYEFLCRQAGVRVAYVSEPFGEDVAPLTTIVKHLKRVMAGEYSRELSAKVVRAKRQQAQLGFRQGGLIIYGFRRLLVDPLRNPRQILQPGQAKALDGDKVIVVPGPPEELAVIRRIFKLYVEQQLTFREIARRLAAAGVRGHGGEPLSIGSIRNIVSNELCIGQMTYNQTTVILQSPPLKNPEEQWTRFRAFEPIVPIELFQQAQALRARCKKGCWSDAKILEALRELLAEKGRLSQLLINDLKDGPTADTVVNHFGSLSAAYKLVGYQPPPRLAFGMNASHWSEGAVMKGLRKLHAAHGGVSLRLIDGCPDLPSTCYIRKHFGSLDEAIRRAGLPVLNHSDKMRFGWKHRKAAGSDNHYAGVHWTDQALLAALRQLHERHGYTTANLVDQNGKTPSAYYYKKRFGSLAKARALAQLPLLTNSQRVSDGRKRGKLGTLIRRKPRFAGQPPGLGFCSKDILVGLRRLAERDGVISARMIDNDPDLPSSSAVANHFGKLSKAYELIGVVRLKGKSIRYGLAPRE
ncbi:MULTISPECIES: recombinase family protein [unclassified Bradyrhizobium]|uniref:recombinase family protein n=1 Tax=unclassified Bradyrhizobium TaxID=2631580 RepID=UPI002915D5C1|nr:MULTISPECIES: recombinase family protein [unclassified Bradyrhizobium]